MRCDEIQERFIDLLYDGQGAPPASPELRGHLASCPSCRQELEELRQVRGALGTWKDEPPLRPGAALRASYTAQPVVPLAWRMARYAAVAAAVVLAFLALANAEVTWNDEGFSFRTRLLAQEAPGSDYYTREEMRELVKRALDDSEIRILEANVVMMQRLMETIERDRWMDLRLIRDQFNQSRERN